jgi:hypothetical protein
LADLCGVAGGVLGAVTVFCCKLLWPVAGLVDCWLVGEVEVPAADVPELPFVVLVVPLLLYVLEL